MTFGARVPSAAVMLRDSVLADRCSELSFSSRRRFCNPGATYTYRAAIATNVTAKNTNARRFRSERTAPPLVRGVAEAVADAPDREDVFRLAGIALELLAKVPDVHVDRARLAVVGAAP